MTRPFTASFKVVEDTPARYRIGQQRPPSCVSREISGSPTNTNVNEFSVDCLGSTQGSCDGYSRTPSVRVCGEHHRHSSEAGDGPAAEAPWLFVSGVSPSDFSHFQLLFQIRAMISFNIHHFSSGQLAKTDGGTLASRQLQLIGLCRPAVEAAQIFSFKLCQRG